MALVPTRSATAAVWAASTVILAKDEVVIASDTGVVKVGDGVRTFANLPTSDNQTVSASEAAGLSDETGTGAAVFATSPTLITPILGAATATSIASTGVNSAAGIDTSSGSAVTSPSVSSGVAFTPSAVSNAEVIFQLAGITGSYSVTYGPSTGAENALATSVPTLLNVGDVIAFMVPKGWKVVLTLATVTLTAARVTTF